MRSQVFAEQAHQLEVAVDTISMGTQSEEEMKRAAIQLIDSGNKARAAISSMGGTPRNTNLCMGTWQNQPRIISRGYVCGSAICSVVVTDRASVSAPCRLLSCTPG